MKTNYNDENEMGSNWTDDDYESQPIILSATSGGLSPLVVNRKRKSITCTNKKEELTLSTDSLTWITGHIPYVSCQYRKPKTAFEVNNADIFTIAQRIFDCNTRRSIQAVYDGAISKCKTTSFMKFTIRLLRVSKGSTDTILVDVRRRTGCSMEFRDEYQAIYSAAVFGEILERKAPRMTMSLTDVKCMNGNYIPLAEGSIERSLQSSMVHLTSKMYDMRILTLQDLLSTTDPSSIDTSPVASKLIVTEYHEIFEYIVGDIVKQVEYDDDLNDDDDSEEYLRSLTLAILGNILTSVLDDKALLSLVHETYCNASMIQSLVWYVRKAQTCPWNSCLAAKCLRLLASTSSEMKSQIGMEEYAVLKKAEEIGKCSYKLLESEANEALIVTSYDN